MYPLPILTKYSFNDRYYRHEERLAVHRQLKAIVEKEGPEEIAKLAGIKPKSVLLWFKCFQVPEKRKYERIISTLNKIKAGC